ncbi:MAG: hypothetical protein D5R99_04170 [Methanocalculus sp. MSAO_Arc1]|uniref:hypothetical protein n=1 Tax=Methanocalculus TaxID=71151 RepID=UPI000FF62F48|nr:MULTISPECIES: hypothetical protein [unclassified Methanocalculus]MCP1662973.1 cell division GTPase FtsZ [Methanocalculus sp. AMF5]RQD80743.1 MAG: hypothetical protein D5R99_04170 [Methanocalculus sp. MSAO_Arc1]
MKALIIGLGGAGSRIADTLHEHDTRSGTHSVWTLAIDTDISSIRELRHIPHSERIVLPSFHEDDMAADGEILDIAEMIQHIQQSTTIEIDAVIICTGLGGRHADAVPLIVQKIRDSFYEPVITILTLPLRNEGKRISARAADQIDVIEPVVDGCILFDNETWYRKIATEMLRLERIQNDGFDDETDDPEQDDEAVLEQNPDTASLNPREANRLLNERLARRFGLLLRAGEFVEGGKPVAEVVLDAGEVINTIAGMGMVAIGYSTEIISRPKFCFLNKFRRNHSSFEEGHMRASRVVELAKRAIYQEISVPCDLTSAEKALVLIAGPTDELSMKGFQNVRKWIDRNITGLEMRAGDYPVINTKYVGVIIVLAGIKNIPRINELREIRQAHLEEMEEEMIRHEESRREKEEILQKREELERKARERAERAALLQQENVWEAEDQDDRVEFVQDTGVAPTPVADEGSPVYHPVEDDGVFAGGEVSLPEREDSAPARKITLPGRQATEVADISRQTAVGGGIRPRDGTMDPQAIRIGQTPVEKGRMPPDTTDGPFSLPENIRARDDTFEAKAIALKSHFSRPDDRAFDGEAITIHRRASRPRDDVLMGKGVAPDSAKRPSDSAYAGGGGAHLRIGGHPTPKDSVGGDRTPHSHPRPRDGIKGRSKFVVIGERSGSENEPEEGDGGITWI